MSLVCSCMLWASTVPFQPVLGNVGLGKEVDAGIE